MGREDFTATILVAANDAVLRSTLLTALAGAGYIAVQAVDGASAQSLLSAIPDIDLVVMDLGPPDVDGLTLLRQERARGVAVPAIILTADNNIASIVEALDAGIADYMVEPVRMPELLARVRLRLREHETANGPDVLEHGGMRLDIRTRQVEVDGHIHTLTNREFAVLEVLLRHQGETVSREQLLHRVRGTGFDGGSDIVSVSIRALRHKISPDAIHTIHGAGYQLR